MDQASYFSSSLIAPCGMDCALCLAYIREKTKCPGCRGNDENKQKSCLHCTIKNCDSLKELSSGFCFDCTKYPCKRLTQLDLRYRTKYHMSMLENLSHIRLSGMQSFLEKEKEKWTCAQCGRPVCVHRGICLHCKQ